MAGLSDVNARLVFAEIETGLGADWFASWLELIETADAQPVRPELKALAARLDVVVQAMLKETTVKAAVEPPTEKRPLEISADTLENEAKRKPAAEAAAPAASSSEPEQVTQEKYQPSVTVDTTKQQSTEAEQKTSQSASTVASNVEVPKDAAKPVEETPPPVSKLAAFLHTAEKASSSPGQSIQKPVASPKPLPTSVTKVAEPKGPSVAAKVLALSPKPAVSSPSSPKPTGTSSTASKSAAPSSPSAPGKVATPSSPVTVTKPVAPSSPSTSVKTTALSPPSPGSPSTKSPAPSSPKPVGVMQSPKVNLHNSPVTGAKSPSPLSTNSEPQGAAANVDVGTTSELSSAPKATKQAEGGHMEVPDECFDLFQEVKIRKKHRFVIFRIHDWKLEILKVGDRSATFDDFLKELPFSECRYAIYDHERMKNDQYGSRKAEKVFFITWQPVPAPTQFKMLYSTERKTLSAIFKGVEEIVATKRDDILYATGTKDKFADEDSGDEERGGKDDWLDD